MTSTQFLYDVYKEHTYISFSEYINIFLAIYETKRFAHIMMTPSLQSSDKSGPHP